MRALFLLSFIFSFSILFSSEFVFLEDGEETVGEETVLAKTFWERCNAKTNSSIVRDRRLVQYVKVDLGFLYEKMIVGNSNSLYYAPDLESITGTNMEINCLDNGFPVNLGLTLSALFVADKDLWYGGIKFGWIEGNVENLFNRGGTRFVQPNGWTSQINVFDTSGTVIIDGSTRNWAESFDKINYSYNVVHYDLAFRLGKTRIFLEDGFVLSPHMGIVAAWNFYNSILNFGNNSAADKILFFNTDTIRQSFNSDTWGCGVEIGLDFCRYLGYSFSLFAENGVALLIGEYANNSCKEYGKIVEDGSITYKSVERPRGDPVGTVTPSTKLLFGINYELGSSVSCRVAMDCSIYWGQHTGEPKDIGHLPTSFQDRADISAATDIGDATNVQYIGDKLPYKSFHFAPKVETLAIFGLFVDFGWSI